MPSLIPEDQNSEYKYNDCDIVVYTHNLLVLQVARLQKNVLRALSQEIVGGQDVQEAISKLESDLLDITMVTLHLYLKTFCQVKSHTWI